MKNSHSTRGEETRDRLLDALESLVVAKGFNGLSHRAIAREAKVHAGLLHYHFGTVERVVEEAIARRASRLTQGQLAALVQLGRHGHFSIADVVRALWAPFEDAADDADRGWRNYLCLIARLASTPAGDALFARYFAEVIDAASNAVRLIHPGATDEAIRAGLRNIRALFEREIAATRCGGETLHPPGRVRSMIDFAAAGFEQLLPGAIPVRSLRAAD